MKSGLITIFIVTTLAPEYLTAQSAGVGTELDQKVKQFLSEQSGQWYDMNVPTVDGKKLFDLVLEGNYKSALEIGTSTGYSGIYIAWALSKTRGKLITIEIDEYRYKTALRNFKEAGLSDYVDSCIDLESIDEYNQLIEKLEEIESDIEEIKETIETIEN